MMQVNLETPEKHAIQSYTDHQIKINNVIYQHNLIITPEHIISDWPIQDLKALNITTLQPCLKFNPEIILIGHPSSSMPMNPEIMQYLSQQRIGFEFMSIGSACRTFNILLSELRRVVLGLIM